MDGYEFIFDDAHMWAARLAAGSGVVQNEFTAAVDRVAAYGLATTIEETAVLTGHLRRSNQLSPTEWVGNGAVGGWYNDAPYAKFVDEGTRFMDAQPFMGPGMEAAREKAEEEFEGAIKRIVAALGG